MPTFVLIVVLWNGAPGVVPGFATRDECYSAGLSFMLETKDKSEGRPRFYCIHGPAQR